MDIIDWSTVDWVTVGTYSLMAFAAAFIANLFSAILGDSRILAAILTAVLFAVLFVAWTYYPHGLNVPLASTATAPVESPVASDPN